MKNTGLLLGRTFPSAQAAMLLLAIVFPPRALSGAPNGEIEPFAAFVKSGTAADRIVPDFVVKFRIPMDTRWSVSPVTERARATFAKSSAKARTVANETVVTVVAGGRARRAGGYERCNAWAYANELRVRYDLRTR
ncbi:hypothetical protein EWI61_10125 [Methylolobus aquaticus]|nr:hypothetical protein EWI61_10125 [Methylolobus aquaticus]